MQAPASLDEEDRHHGRVAFLLVTNWHDWVKRRVESVTFLNTAAIVRRTSIDFRVRSWLPDPVLEWGAGDEARGYHYIPLALLDKQPLQAFDLRDETGCALPLLTRRKNAAIAAGTLVAAAQFAIHSFLARRRAIGGPDPSPSPLPPDVLPQDILLPAELETDFWELAYREPINPVNVGAGDAAELIDRFRGSPAFVGDAGSWTWEQDEAGRWLAKGVSASMWRWQLWAERNFRDLAADFARLFMVTTPVAAEPRQRRIIKLSYQQQLSEPLSRGRQRLRKRLDKVTKSRDPQTRFEDWLEGLPRHDKNGESEWADPPRPVRGLTLQPTRLRLRVAQFLSWSGNKFSFDIPAVSEGGSFHFEVDTPGDLQVRRATLTANAEGHASLSIARRGARSLQRVHLYLSDAPGGAWGAATVTIKPRASTLIRTAAIFSILIAAALVVTAVGFVGAMERAEEVSPLAALLLVAPGLLAASAARPNEHPLTNGLIFGLRCVVLAVGVCPVLAAVLLVTNRGGDNFDCQWRGLALLALLLAVILSVAWRLATRHRPSGTAP